MASPFPGMDPYLEGELWLGFHDRLAEQICEQIAPRISPKYVALLTRRYVMTQPSAGGEYLSRGKMLISGAQKTTPINPPCNEFADCPEISQPAIELPSPLPEEISLVSVELRDIAERRLVTVIEILCPMNKLGDGVRAYRRRRTALLRTSAHLLEIDLLRQGERIELLGEPPPAAYYIYLSRVQRRPFTQIWPVGLQQILPVVPVPVLPPDTEVPLDLQAAVNGCFSRENYDRMLDYSAPLSHLNEEDNTWVGETLGASGRIPPKENTI